MKNFFWTILILFAVALFFWAREKANPPANNGAEKNVPGQEQVQNSMPLSYAPEPQPLPVEQSATGFVAPLDRAKERVSKKPFGIFITSQTSPVQPEKFRGYHTGADFEIFPEELNAGVSVKAVCAGKLLVKRTASGYGGVAVQSCVLDGAPITVVYGHLNLKSIEANVGDMLSTGDALGNLGADKSTETDGERKHLHLGFHKGSAINILGYVQNRNELVSWLNPCRYVCGK